MICLTLLQALHVYWSGKTAVTDLVSTRIYRIKRSQQVSTLPALTYRKVSGQDELFQTGTSTLAQARIEIDCWGSTPAQAETLRDAIRDVTQRYSGTINGSLTIVLAYFENDGEAYDPPQDASDDGTYVATIDLFVWWRPVAPTG